MPRTNETGFTPEEQRNILNFGVQHNICLDNSPDGEKAQHFLRNYFLGRVACPTPSLGVNCGHAHWGYDATPENLGDSLRAFF